MMKNLITIVAAVWFTSHSAIAQRLAIGGSLGLVMDRNWNSPIIDDIDGWLSNHYFNIYSKVPYRAGLVGELQVSSSFTPSLGIGLVHRSLELYINNYNIAKFKHLTLEMPLNFPLRIKIAESTNIILNGGIGIAMNLTPSDRTTISYSQAQTWSSYQFSIRSKNTFSGFIVPGIGVESVLPKGGRLQVNLKYTAPFKGTTEYKVSDAIFTQRSKFFRAWYGLLELVYFPRPSFNKH